MQIETDYDVLPSDEAMGRRVLEVLHSHYPQWSWIVDVPPNQNLVIVRNLDVDPRGKYGFAIHKGRMIAGDAASMVMLAGGEFLERWRVRRTTYDDNFERGLVGGAEQIFKAPDS